DRIHMEEFLRTMNATFQNMLTHTVELTKHMSSGKSAVDGMRSNWLPNNRPMHSSNNGMPKPTSKTAPIRPMVQGYTVHQPSIFLQRCNVPSLEEELRLSGQIENDDSDRLPTIFEESNSDADSSPVSTNMMQEMVRESINFVDNARKKKSRLGRLGYRSSNSGEMLFLGNSRTDVNSSNQEEAQNSADNLSPVMSNVINIRRRNATSTVTSSPNFRRHASPRSSDREPVVKLQKLDSIPHLNLYRSSLGCRMLIDEDKPEVAKNHTAPDREVDPLEGSSWMYCNNTPTQRRTDRRRKSVNVSENNVSYIVDDDDEDDDDIIEASPASKVYEARSKTSSLFKSKTKLNISTPLSSSNNQNYKSCSVVCEKIIDTCSDNSDVEIVKPVAAPKPTDNSQSNVNVSSNSSLEFTGFVNEQNRVSLVTLNRLIDNMLDDAQEQQNTHGVNGKVEEDTDAPPLEVSSEKVSPRSSPRKTGTVEENLVESQGENIEETVVAVGIQGENVIDECNNLDNVDPEVVVSEVNNVGGKSKKKQNTSSREQLEQSRTSPRKRSKLEASVAETGNVPSEDEDDVPVVKLKMKQKTTASSPSRRSNRLDRDISVNNGLENETVDCEPSAILVDCSSITKRRKMKTTPASGRKNESSHENSRRETPKESIGTIVMKRRLSVSLQRLSLKSNKKINALKKSAVKNDQKTADRKLREKKKKSVSQDRRNKKVSQDSNQNLSTASNFDEFGIQKTERSRRNRAPTSYKELNLHTKLRRSK
ncbi:hypothetical protein LSTR_LSTR003086, partial [Laodelphax striatellus]